MLYVLVRHRLTEDIQNENQGILAWKSLPLSPGKLIRSLKALCQMLNIKLNICVWMNVQKKQVSTVKLMGFLTHKERMRNQTIFWSCWARSDLLSSYKVSELRHTHVIPCESQWEDYTDRNSNKVMQDFYSIAEKKWTNPKNVWKDHSKPVTLQFSFNTTAGSTDNNCIPQHSLVIALPFCIEGCVRVSSEKTLTCDDLLHHMQSSFHCPR